MTTSVIGVSGLQFPQANLNSKSLISLYFIFYYPDLCTSLPHD